MKFNTKSILKKVSLVLAGITAVTALGFGVKAIVDYTKNDLKTITPTFEVGNLGTDGKYVNDESTLYTKSAFEAEGLQVKLDFDAQINYQIFYYDDLDNFVESTAVLSAAYSETVHDGYARIVIIPTDDEDDKISLTERVTYPAQMTIKVSKDQDIHYYNVFNKRLMVVDNVSSLRFRRFGVQLLNGSRSFVSSTTHSSTCLDLLSVKGYSSVTLAFPSDADENCLFFVYGFSEDSGVLSISHIYTVTTGSSVSFDKDVDYLVFEYRVDGNGALDSTLSDSTVSTLFKLITLSKSA